MEEAGLSVQDLDAIAISSGPGSFTALRIGMAAAKGIAYGAGKQLVPVPTLPAMAVAAFGHTAFGTVVPVIAAGTGEYYYAICQRDRFAAGEETAEVQRCRVQELSSRLEGVDGEYVIAGRSIGELAVMNDGLKNRCIEADFFTAESIIPLAKSLLTGGRHDHPSAVEPEYSQLFIPGIKKQ
jgi:tRNA threonylcarbamoyladenosine biosynthesis protein TsaB